MSVSSKTRPLEHVKCNQCGADDTKPRYQVDGYFIVECRQCALIYVNPRLSQAELSGIYSRDYYENKEQSYNQKFFSDYAGERKVRSEEFKGKLDEILEFLGPKRGRLLDVGCAMGFFLDVARAAGFEAEGVEISEYSSLTARKELGCKVFTGSLENAKFPSESFDVVTSWDCVEHVPDPTSFLKEIKRILKKDGLAVIETMNMDSVGAVLYQENFKPIRPEGHIYYFTTSSFLRMLNKVGFETVHIGFPYFNGRWFNVDEIERLLEDLKEYKKGKKIDRKSPAFWGNLVCFYITKR